MAEEQERGGPAVAFTHFHVQSEWSLLESSARITSIVRQAAAQGHSAVALTDRHNLYGAPAFYEECRKAGVKPIIGAKLTVHADKNCSGELLCIVREQAGYPHLIRLITELWENGGSLPLSSVSGEHLVIIEPMLTGLSTRLLMNGEEDQAWQMHQRIASRAAETYIEISPYGRETGRDIRQTLARWRDTMEEPPAFLAGARVLSSSKEDAQTPLLLQAIAANTAVQEDQHQVEGGPLVSEEELIQDLPGWQAAVEEAGRLAEKCSWKLPEAEVKLPSYPSGLPAPEALEKWCRNGLMERYDTPPREAEARLSYELSIINRMGFADYFLIVADFMAYCRNEGITTGPGRGSAAGSLTAHLLGITEVDPLEYGLLFERFLNPERVTMPDIDIDFADVDRDRVIHYAADKYGMDRVAQIITFGTFAAKAALRDAGRALGFDSYAVDRIARAVPAGPSVTLEEAGKDRRFADLIEKEQAAPLLRAAERLEGLPRHTSIHAAGVVMSSVPLTDYMPLQPGKDGMKLTQFPMGDLERLGLLKMDFLGLRNLTLLDRMEALAGTSFSDIPMDEPSVYKLLSKGKTRGIFQLESGGMQRVLKQMQPTTFEDIVAVNALYRPGPMAFITDYIDGKHGRKTPDYVHPDLKPILETTFGVLIYQEQIMQIAVKMAGFTPGGADLLRRAVSKKKREELEKGRRRFLEGAQEKGHTAEDAEKVYDLIVRFADYGFNRSHAVAYSIISYRLAYVKAVHPHVFYTAMMEGLLHDQEKLAAVIDEAKSSGIRLLPPDINNSSTSFSIETESIRTGLGAIRFISTKTADLLSETKPYSDLFELCASLPQAALQRRTLEALIHSGACDSFGETRATLLATLDAAMSYAAEKRRENEEGAFLFPDEQTAREYERRPAFSHSEELDNEKEYLGFYVSGHPLEAYSGLLSEYGRTKIIDLPSDGICRTAGLIQTIRSIRTKKGALMAFMELEDESGIISVTVFPKAYEAYQLQLVKGAAVFLEVRVDEHDGEKKLILEKAVQIEEWMKRLEEKKKDVLHLYITADAERRSLTKVKKLLDEAPGSIPVRMTYQRSGQTMQLSEMWNVKADDVLLKRLGAVLGSKNVLLHEGSGSNF
ncbi:DNA polymerase III subunit alpha [Alkalicoccus urumqiensis]|uniref:DNA polymerase III subunit alpha n=1 Tax=Alkalicoccus urumqiensis TaxID=1548213 RepID=A0A2P6MDG9_ALKUR|nr:DNA polymerase III subunit alpha [Alkalicoccus urumqiensis]PRO64328.1 DNA polymerase III subunit alpha [Alkalicoccus urumqiensis]